MYAKDQLSVEYVKKSFFTMKQYHNHRRSCTQKISHVVFVKKQMSHSDTLAIHMKQY